MLTCSSYYYRSVTGESPAISILAVPAGVLISTETLMPTGEVAIQFSNSLLCCEFLMIDISIHFQFYNNVLRLCGVCRTLETINHITFFFEK